MTRTFSGDSQILIIHREIAYSCWLADPVSSEEPYKNLWVWAGSALCHKYGHINANEKLRFFSYEVLLKEKKLFILSVKEFLNTYKSPTFHL